MGETDIRTDIDRQTDRQTNRAGIFKKSMGDRNRGGMEGWAGRDWYWLTMSRRPRAHSSLWVEGPQGV